MSNLFLFLLHDYLKFLHQIHSTDKIDIAASVCNIRVNKACDLSYWACVRYTQAWCWNTVCLTSTGNPVPGKQEFCLAPSETIVEQVKNKKSHSGHRLRTRTLGDMLGRSLEHFT
jgi:hypothetical protein